MVTHQAAVITLINNAGGHAYAPGAAASETPVPACYTEVYVAGGPDANNRVGSLGGMQTHRILTRVVSATEAAAVAERDLIVSGLRGSIFDADAESFGPIRREAFDEPIAYDYERAHWSGVSSWVYA